MDSFVGEVALFEETGSKRHLRSATVIAKSHCELYAVSAHVFGEICKKYPQARRVMLTLARQRVERTDSLRKEYLRKTQGWRVALDVMRLAAPSTSSSIGQASASADAGIALTDLSVSAPSPSAAPARAPSPSAAPASAPSPSQLTGKVVVGTSPNADDNPVLMRRMQALESGQARLEAKLDKIVNMLQAGEGPSAAGGPS